MLILNSVRRRVQALDGELPLSQPMTLKEILGYETVAPRFVMALFSCFAGLGLALAAAGIFSVISYDVSQKVHEIGVRLALGATRSNIVFHVLRSAYKVVSVGILAGLCGSLLAVRLIRSQLFTNTPFDVVSILVIGLLLSAVALLAAFLPARRAGRLDPLVAMRHEA
jgi:ABC-type antimicrobial peptide transport system permease subunit